MLKNAQSGTLLDLDCGKLTNGTKVQGWNVHGCKNQHWEFVGVTEQMLGRKIQVPGPERVVEKVVPGPERVVERIVPGPERVIERVIQGPERVVERIVVNFNDSPDTLKELRELRAQVLRALEGLGQTLPKVAVFDTTGDRQNSDG